MTPHRPSMDSFWDQETTNAWNDEFSPRKMPKAHPRNLFSQYANSLESEHTLAGTSPAKNEKLARQAKKVFSKQKHELAQTFLAELDNAITDGQLAKLAAATGGIKITWSKKLNTTAGRANWKRETIRPCSRGPENSSASLYRHHAEIELAEKVIDDEKRLLNVIAHEFCHLANFMVSNIKTNPHGKEFKAWAAKCSAHFGDRGIEVTTKHSYTIEYKYVWECTNCGIEFKRHSKSIDTMKHQCGNCKSKLVQTKPAPRTGSGKATEYQNFVKENMGKIKAGNPQSPQKEILGLVAKKYQEVKATKMREEERHCMSLQSISKEASPDDDGISTISRELNFLDLTSS
jgi:predicted SprT family Zn-dependent metalloprotease